MSDPSEMQITTLTVVRQTDVSHTWAKQLWEETRQCNILVEITVSFLSNTRHLAEGFIINCRRNSSEHGDSIGKDYDLLGRC